MPDLKPSEVAPAFDFLARQSFMARYKDAFLSIFGPEPKAKKRQRTLQEESPELCTLLKLANRAKDYLRRRGVRFVFYRKEYTIHNPVLNRTTARSNLLLEGLDPPDGGRNSLCSSLIVRKIPLQTPPSF